MLISEIMTTALITAHPGDLVDEALFEMKLASIRHLPVVSNKRKLLGIVSDRDVLLSIGLGADRNVYLRDIMTKNVETVEADSDAALALTTMLDRKIGSLLVVSEKGDLVGVVTDTDFLQIARHFLAQSETSRPGVGWRE